MAQHLDCSAIISQSARTSSTLYRLADMPNMLQSAHSFIHSSSSSSCCSTVLLSLPPSALPQPHPALHPYLALYLPACLSRPLGPSHFHSYNALFCFHASRMEVGEGARGVGMDGGMISLIQQREEWWEEPAGSILESSSLIKLHACAHTHARENPHCVIQ